MINVIEDTTGKYFRATNANFLLAMKRVALKCVPGRMIFQFKLIVLASTVLLLTACANNNAKFGGGLRILDNDPTVKITLPRDWRALGDTPAEKSLRNAMEFAEQKRFGEARRVLAQLREGVSPRSETYRLLTASMAHLSLRSGDIATARRLGRQLENTLEDRTRTDPAVTNIIAITRALDGGETPINTPTSLSSLLREIDTLAVKKADANWTPN